MKRLISILFVFVLVLMGCQTTRSAKPEFSGAYTESIVIKVLPSPPKMKTVSEAEDIDAIINHLNSIDKKETNLKDLKGWEINIQMNGKEEHGISFVGDLLSIDGVFYEVADDEADKFRTLYEGLSYIEEDVIPR